jgi:hypothetical protein
LNKERSAIDLLEEVHDKDILQAYRILVHFPLCGAGLEGE